MEGGSYVMVSGVFHLEKKDRSCAFLACQNVVRTQILQQIQKAYLEETCGAALDRLSPSCSSLRRYGESSLEIGEGPSLTLTQDLIVPYECMGRDGPWEGRTTRLNLVLTPSSHPSGGFVFVITSSNQEQ